MANASSGKLTLSFEVYNGTQHLFRKDLSAESVTIGRGPAAMLRVEDDALADLHAVINVNDDGTVQLLDLGSSAGTHVNGEKISNTQLRTGDSIQIGSIRLAISIVDASSASILARIRVASATSCSVFSSSTRFSTESSAASARCCSYIASRSA